MQSKALPAAAPDARALSRKSDVAPSRTPCPSVNLSCLDQSLAARLPPGSPGADWSLFSFMLLLPGSPNSDPTPPHPHPQTL